MGTGLFKEVSATEQKPNWQLLVKRQQPIYSRGQEIRGEFARDYNRILHSTAYRRLKKKTQVFFATSNDHICTRIEHVNHVAAVSYTIANYLGLNTELTNAVALGHDLGHAPFGHVGEMALAKIVREKTGETFWHEKNSLRFVDMCETLLGPDGCEHNLNLTYAVRDGILLHCGEVDENSIIPREDFIDLETVEKASQYTPITWEGCVVKIADKIAYLGRDIEDALALNILDKSQLNQLKKITGISSKVNLTEINNTVLMHNFIMDLCTSSTPEKGISFSPEHLELINSLKEFNYKYIYLHERLETFHGYAELIIRSIFNTLGRYYKGNETLVEIEKLKSIYPILARYFSEWLVKYSDLNNRTAQDNTYKNEIIYKMSDEKDYLRAVADFISGMTDSFAIKVFNELTSF
jgi:dGTPase